MIEIAGLEGAYHADRCEAPNLGWLSVTYPVDSLSDALARLEQRVAALHIAPFETGRAGLGPATVFAVRSPDGAINEFAELGGSPRGRHLRDRSARACLAHHSFARRRPAGATRLAAA